MSIWTRIADALSALAAGEGLSVVFDRLRGVQSTPEKSVAFTIAVIALGAKMAKADGHVTRHEVSAFRHVFALPDEEAANAARVFNLARQDVAGFDAYARKVAAMFRPEGQALCADDRNVLIDLLEGLFHIAMADGDFHPAEDAFLHEVARIFGLDDRCYGTMRARFVEGAPRDPYDVLGVSADAPMDQVRAAWRQAVKDSHPDAMIARGVPAEAVKLAERRLIAINAAWDEISGRRAA
ncbi:molecular chaperone DjiA [Pseudotabrizicola formosa]|uniref:molecular chaperone DjiA n=1 Tax=Pseudotabrizicola formosa TaxID=2030009 RepID=UPI000CD26607|nr:molecular chaperone DjiA [Pseudotabrizicola formosa]